MNRSRFAFVVGTDVLGLSTLTACGGGNSYPSGQSNTSVVDGTDPRNWYQFAQDSKAGDVKGQGVGGIWWVVGPDGKKITTQHSDSGNNGY